MNAQIVWNNVMRAAEEVTGNKKQLTALFESLEVAKALLEQLLKENEALKPPKGE